MCVCVILCVLETGKKGLGIECVLPVCVFALQEVCMFCSQLREGGVRVCVMRETHKVCVFVVYLCVCSS